VIFDTKPLKCCLRERSRRKAARVGAIGPARSRLKQGDPITLILGASRFDLSHFAGEVNCSVGEVNCDQP